jgi:LacI family transcriptional regulator
MPHPPSLRSLAREAKVSLTTASRALSGHPQTAEETRQHVAAVAERIGYRRNALASSVMRDFKRGRMAKQREVFAYLCWDPPTKWNTPEREFYRRILRGIERRAAELGTDVMVTWLRDPKIPLPRVGGILRARGVRGLVLAPVPDIVHLPEFPWADFAAVTIGNMMLTPRLHRLQTEHGENVALCLAHMELRKAQRIGYVADAKVDRRTGNLAVSRFAYYQTALPVGRRIPPLIWDTWNPDKFAAWLDRHEPDAVVFQGESGLPLHAVLQQRRYRHIHFCVVAAQLQSPHIAGTLPRHETLGAKAVDLVSVAIAHHDYGPPAEPMNLYIPGEWREASSTTRIGAEASRK